MDFSLSEEHMMLKESVAKFAAKELQPIAEEIDQEDKWPEEKLELWALPLTRSTVGQVLIFLLGPWSAKNWQKFPRPWLFRGVPMSTSAVTI